MYLPPDVEKIIDTLENAGFEAYAVGGCVRDYLMGIIPDDDLNKRFKTMTLEQSSEYLTKIFDLSVSKEELFQIFMENVKHGYENEAPLKPGVMEFLTYLKFLKLLLQIYLLIVLHKEMVILLLYQYRALNSYRARSFR